MKDTPVTTITMTPPGDNEWHEVRIGRYESFITLEVDGTQKSERLVNPTLVKYNKEMFIGGMS